MTSGFVICGANRAYLRATGRALEDLYGRFMFDAFPDNPDDPAADGVANPRASLERAVATCRPDTMAVQRYDITRYLPARADLAVCGDWYDVSDLGGDVMGVVVGDVVGHGL